MLLKFIYRKPFFKKIMRPVVDKWTENKVQRFVGFVPRDDRIIDLGAGNCFLTKNLIGKGYNVTAVDVANLAVANGVKPIVYDGENIPFDNNSFDTLLLITVLHHCDDPDKVLKEAMRVSDKMVIIEDTYGNRVQKFIMQGMDTIVNFGHSKMTYQNKSEKGWEVLFDELNLKILSKRRKSVLFFLRQTTYHLKK
jgi:ubiquinone/menaquinone biosynthesis C-methylase UbiE